MPRAGRLYLIIFAVVLLADLTLCLRVSRSANASSSSEYTDWSSEGEDMYSSEGGSRWLSHRESQLLLRKEAGEKGVPVDCCPSTLEMVEPQGGTNLAGMFVTLFREGDSRQRFYELSCREGVAGKPCRFMDRKLHNQSRCVQMYSYTYAIVKQPEDGGRHHHKTGSSSHFPAFPANGSNWMLDYIKVRSGCSCQVSPRSKRKRIASPSRKRGKPTRLQPN